MSFISVLYKRHRVQLLSFTDIMLMSYSIVSMSNSSKNVQADVANNQVDDRDGTNGQDLNSANQSEIIQYVIQKVERISQALYVLTGYLPADEPFRRNVREKALRMIDDLYQLQVDAQPQPAMVSKLVSVKFTELEAVLRVGQRAGLMSDMNCQVLVDEMINLQQIVSDKLSDKTPQLTGAFFKDSLKPHGRTMLATPLQRDFEESQSASVRSTIDLRKPRFAADQLRSNAQNGSRSSNESGSNKFSDPSQSGNQNDGNSRSNDSSNSNSRRRHGRNHSKRRQAILSLFTDLEEITITNVQEVVEGCSQKTMQRELKSMVDDGLLEKHGKRRWSSYTLGEGVELSAELSN